jgi:hypothetical protein
MTFTAWVQFLNNCDDSRGTTYRFCRKHKFVSLLGIVSTGWRLLGVPFVTVLKSNLCTAVTTQNTTENNCTMSQEQNTTALQPDVFSTGVHRLLVTNTGPSGFSSANCCSRSTANSPVSSNVYVLLEYDSQSRIRCVPFVTVWPVEIFIKGGDLLRIEVTER